MLHSKGTIMDNLERTKPSKQVNHIPAQKAHKSRHLYTILLKKASILLQAQSAGVWQISVSIKQPSFVAPKRLFDDAEALRLTQGFAYSTSLS